MTARQLLLSAALLMSVGLVLFDDRVPDTETDLVTDRVRTTTARVPGHSAPKLADASPSVQTLLPRPPWQPLPKEWPDRPPRLFSAHSWTSTAVPKAVVDAGPPTAPPLPFAYLGMKRQDAALHVFLASGDKTYVVQQGDMLGDLYRVDHIDPPVMKLVYLPLQQVQTLQIGVLE